LPARRRRRGVVRRRASLAAPVAGAVPAGGAGAGGAGAFGATGATGATGTASAGGSAGSRGLSFGHATIVAASATRAPARVTLAQRMRARNG